MRRCARLRSRFRGRADGPSRPAIHERRQAMSAATLPLKPLQLLLSLVQIDRMSIQTESTQADAAAAAAAALLASMQLRYFSSWPSLQLCEQPGRGRFLIARAPIAAGSLVFASLSYCKGVHESFKKRVCECCLRYNHSGRFQRTCEQCRAVWFCSDQCEARANGRPTPNAPPLPASELHSLDCSLLRKLSSCKLDKARMGVIRLLIRAARKMQCEVAAEEQNQSSGSSNADAASSQAVAASSAADVAASDPLLPTYRDMFNLVGHAAAPLVAGRPPTIHQLDTIDMRKFLTKLVATTSAASLSATTAPPLPPLDVELLMDLLAKVEANAFGFFSPKSEEQAAGDPAEAVDEITQAVESLSTNETEATAGASAPPAAAASSAAAPLPAAATSSKYIGVLLYPIASFFNHSCESNLRCEMLPPPPASPADPAASGSAAAAPHATIGPKLEMIANRDIGEGEELHIEYIDCERSGAERRAELQKLYRFDCGCTRCVREQAAEAVASAAGKKSSGSASAARPSYAPAASNRGGQTKKGAPPKRKKIVPKSMQQQAAIEEAHASAATED